MYCNCGLEMYVADEHTTRDVYGIYVYTTWRCECGEEFHDEGYEHYEDHDPSMIEQDIEE